MNDNMTTTADECMQFYDYHQQPLMDLPSIEEEGGLIMDYATMTSSSSHNIITRKGRGNCAIFKPPIRRRSRASKSTPITLLKANTSNFRALVQQFTGYCPTTTTIHKGPITLNFQQQNFHQQQHHTEITTTTTTRAMPPPPFGTIYSSNYQDSVLNQQQSGYCVPTSSGNSYDRPISCMDDGFLFDNNDLSLHELTNDIHGLFM